MRPAASRFTSAEWAAAFARDPTGEKALLVPVRVAACDPPGLLRQIAYRLPGFAGSNLPYLFGNFFDFAANIEEEPARRVVRLGQPPLHLVLNMTGMNRQSYRLSWLDERPFALFNSE